MGDAPDAASVAIAIRGYRRLLEDFVSGSLSADDFERDYLSKYLANDEQYAPDVFGLVDAFFADVDAYVGDPALMDAAAGDLDETQLRSLAKDLLTAAGHGEGG